MGRTLYLLLACLVAASCGKFGEPPVAELPPQLDTYGMDHDLLYELQPGKLYRWSVRCDLFVMPTDKALRAGDRDPATAQFVVAENSLGVPLTIEGAEVADTRYPAWKPNTYGSSAFLFGIHPYTHYEDAGRLSEREFLQVISMESRIKWLDKFELKERKRFAFTLDLSLDLSSSSRPNGLALIEEKKVIYEKVELELSSKGDGKAELRVKGRSFCKDMRNDSASSS